MSFTRQRRLALLATALSAMLAQPGVSFAQAGNATTADVALRTDLAAWRADVQALGTELPRRHKNAFARISAAEWQPAVMSLERRLPQLRQHEIIVELMRLVALIGDAHTNLSPDTQERDASRAAFTLERDGQQRIVMLSGSRKATEVLGLGDSLPRGWSDMRDPQRGPNPLWLERPGLPFWFTITPERQLHIVYRGVQFYAQGETNEAFFRRAFAAGDSAGVTSVVVDMRENGGGNNTINRYLVREILRRPALDRPDRLFVLIGRHVFSAAQNLVNELDYYTGALFVGEPTGNAPSFRRLSLSNSPPRTIAPIGIRS